MGGRGRPRTPYQPDEGAIFITRSEARKIIDVDKARTFDDLDGYWLIPEARGVRAAHKVYRMTDILALKNGARAAVSSGRV